MAHIQRTRCDHLSPTTPRPPIPMPPPPVRQMMCCAPARLVLGAPLAPPLFLPVRSRFSLLPPPQSPHAAAKRQRNRGERRSLPTTAKESHRSARAFRMALHQHHAGSASGSASASSSSSGLHLPASPFGDTTHTKLFVGGLAWETTSERLRRFYERFGDILEAAVITDRHSGRSKGYGFVTFRDPESATKACEEPSPVIDGRRANCNLASLGRAQPSTPLGRPRSAGSYFGVPVPRGIYVGGYGQHRQLPLGYHQYQGIPVPQYSYSTYGTEYIYPQGTLNPYVGQQYVPVYGVSAAANTANQPFSQLSPSISGGGNGYPMMHGYSMPGNQFVHLTGSNLINSSPTNRPTIQAPFLVAAPVASHPHLVVPAHSPQFTQASGSD